MQMEGDACSSNMFNSLTDSAALFSHELHAPGLGPHRAVRMNPSARNAGSMGHAVRHGLIDLPCCEVMAQSADVCIPCSDQG